MEPEVSLSCLKNPPLDHILRQMNPVHTFKDSFREIHLNIILSSLMRSTNGLFPSVFRNGQS